ncbi:MAG: hypothetical protein IJ692_06005 [Alloprevotella sp.]|nr:hypothetical protein [Alloprevotella sp.]
MKKTLLLLVVMLCAAWSVNAQVFRSPKAAASAQPKATIAPTAGQAWWGPAVESDVPIGYGTRTAETIYLAAMFNSAKYGLADLTVRAIRVYIPKLARTEIGDSVVVWLGTSRPTTAEKANVAYKTVDVSDLTFGAYNDISFDEPYTMTSRSLYAGYTFRIASASSEDAQYPMPTIDNVNEECGWIKTSSTMTTWTNFATNYDRNIPVSLLFEGEFLDNGAQAVSAGSAKMLKGTSGKIDFTLRNLSPKGISSFAYTVTDANGTQEERTVNLEQPCIRMGNLTTPISLDAGAEARTDNAVVDVVKVNGVENVADESVRKATSNLVIFSRAGTKRVVEEEFTGTWCGWCPRGMVGMELAEKEFGDKFIGIAVHKGSSVADPMETSGNGYTTVLNTYISGFPSCLLDRTSGAIDPYYGTGEQIFSLKDDFNARLSLNVEADIELNAEWTTADKKTVKAETNTTFYLNADKSNYAIGFVMVSDSLKGTSSQWAQTNYFASYAANYANEPNLKPLTQMGSRIVGMAYNHVAILGRGVDKGLTNSVKAPITDGEAQTYSTTMTVPTSTSLVQNKDNLRVIALLFDTTTGDIVNAAEAHIAPPTGVNDVVVKDADRVVGRYNLQGQRVDATQHGVVIVKYADGHSEKVLK